MGLQTVVATIQMESTLQNLPLEDFIFIFGATLQTTVAVRFSTRPFQLLIKKLRDCGPRWQSLLLPFLHNLYLTMGLRATVTTLYCLAFSPSNSTTMGLWTVVAVSFNALPAQLVFPNYGTAVTVCLLLK